MTGQNIMDFSAALLNDPSKKLFTYAKQLPYLQIALQELREECENANIPNTNKVSLPIIVPVGKKDIGGVSGIALPTDLIEPITIWERNSGSSTDFQLMDKKEFLPETQVMTNSFGVWTWNQQIIEFLGANSDREIKIHYTNSPIADIATGAETVTMINSTTFLSYRTSALVARFVGQNTTRAEELDAFAKIGLDRVLNIDIKGKQSIATRRRPFRARFKSYTGF